MPLLALVLSACALTREPVRKPDLPLPEVLPAVTGATAALPDPWWILFDDPALDAMIREALTQNTDVTAAAARVAEARALAQIAGADRLPSLDLEAGATRGRNSVLFAPDLEPDGSIQNEFAVRGAVRYEVDLGAGTHTLPKRRARDCWRANSSAMPCA